MPALAARSGAGANSIRSPEIIAGIAVAGAAALALALWLLVRFVRKRAQAKREDARGAAFLQVRGLVREDEKQEPLPKDVLSDGGAQFSRANLTADVPMPKAAFRSDADSQEIMEYYATSGAVPKPFSPFTFALQAGAAAPPAAPAASDRSSWRSSIFNAFGAIGAGAAGVGSSRASASHLSVLSSTHRVSTASSASGTARRKVRQVFNPVLPDELVLNVGESVNVVQPFDDGWCIVGRDNPFKKGDVELGACPAWCFIKPVKGLRTERPVRSASLGVTVTLDVPRIGSRDDILSWSNF